ncbi:MAG: DUF2254 domain-containing protein [Halothiobacillus sp.]|jgi:uncharacterized membrane protein|nr:DUF2254 domain-containing protein [Halothiobacillus sp.]
MNKFKQIWSNLRSSFWFVPSLIVAVSIALAMALIEADFTRTEQWLALWPRLFGAGAEGARGMLSTIAGSMMTVVGVTFSMVLMTLALASSQYTSRILRNFMSDRVTQVVLGLFAGIFTYCLIVLRTIRGGEDGVFVPSLAVSFSVVLAMGGIGVLIFFIHHIAASIQASNIIASVSDETMLAVDRLFPEKLGDGQVDDDEAYPTPSPLPEQVWKAVLPAKGNGYIQSLDNAALLRLACENKTIVRMEHAIGEFVVHGTALASLALEKPPEKEIIGALQAAYDIDRHRTVSQDAAFGILQIVDIALKALSPSINDTTTAAICVDYLSAILARLASRPIPSSHRYVEGELRVIAKGPNFESLLAQAFDQIRRSSNGNVVIMLRILGTLQTLAGLTASPGRRGALRDQVLWISELAERTLESAHDRARIDTRLACVREVLEAEPASSAG